MRLHIRTANELETFNDVQRKINEAIHEEENRVRRSRMNRLEFLQKLRALTNATLKLGVGVVDETLKDQCMSYTDNSLFRYLKKVLQDDERPAIMLWREEGYIEHGKYGGSRWSSFWKLVVPKNPRLKNIVSGLLLVAENQVGSDDPHVLHNAHDRSWEFLFLTPEGKEILEHWLQQCKEDAIFQVCLGTRLPSK